MNTLADWVGVFSGISGIMLPILRAVRTARANRVAQHACSCACHHSEGRSVDCPHDGRGSDAQAW